MPRVGRYTVVQGVVLDYDKPLTGIKTRREFLAPAPLPNSSWAPPDDDPAEERHCVPDATSRNRRIEAFQQRFPRPDRAARKVVFGYDDAYNFSRIVMADDLVFDSHFESGNLSRASRIAKAPFDDRPDTEYELVLSNDVHSKGHVQWFFFSVSNMRPRCMYTFHIVNFVKPDSMYNYGMKPLMYSTRAAFDSGVGWQRVGDLMDGICYYKCPRDCPTDGVRKYILTFTVRLEHAKDKVYFAYCFPYTFTDLQRHLSKVTALKTPCCIVQRETMCKTLAGNVCDLLTIHDGQQPGTTIVARRKVIVLSARVHPGESNASWIMEGLLDFLTGPSDAALWLRSRYVFKVAPMLNPDGVINGNYRTSLSGHDLNRRWLEPDPVLHPTVASLRNLIEKCQQEVGVELYCDIHGHSRKEGVFMYGCVQPQHEGESNPTRNLPRVLPMLMQHTCPMFTYAGCNFKVQASKANTARVVVFRQLGVLHSFTMEASFCGFGTRHFRTTDLLDAGRHFCQALATFCQIKRKARRAALLRVSTADGAKAATPQFSVSHTRAFFESFTIALAGDIDKTIDEEGNVIESSHVRVPDAAKDAVTQVTSLGDTMANLPSRLWPPSPQQPTLQHTPPAQLHTDLTPSPPASRPTGRFRRSLAVAIDEAVVPPPLASPPPSHTSPPVSTVSARAKRMEAGFVTPPSSPTAATGEGMVTPIALSPMAKGATADDGTDEEGWQFLAVLDEKDRWFLHGGAPPPAAGAPVPPTLAALRADTPPQKLAVAVSVAAAKAHAKSSVVQDAGMESDGSDGCPSDDNVDATDLADMLAKSGLVDAAKEVKQRRRRAPPPAAPVVRQTQPKGKPAPTAAHRGSVSSRRSSLSSASRRPSVANTRAARDAAIARLVSRAPPTSAAKVKAPPRPAQVARDPLVKARPRRRNRSKNGMGDRHAKALARRRMLTRTPAGGDSVGDVLQATPIRSPSPKHLPTMGPSGPAKPPLPSWAPTGGSSQAGHDVAGIVAAQQHRGGGRQTPNGRTPATVGSIVMPRKPRRGSRPDDGGGGGIVVPRQTFAALGSRSSHRLPSVGSRSSLRPKAPAKPMSGRLAPTSSWHVARRSGSGPPPARRKAAFM